MKFYFHKTGLTHETDMTAYFGKDGVALDGDQYSVFLTKFEFEALLNHVINKRGGIPKELECIKDDIEYIMEKSAKCKDRDKLRSILEALEVITAKI